MKTNLLLSLVVVSSFAAFAQEPPPPRPLPAQPPVPLTPAPRPMRGGAEPAAAESKDTANYSVTVTWTNPKQETNSIKVLTAEGSFSLDTVESSVRIDDYEVPTTVSLSGSLKSLDDQKASIKLFLGRTVPYVTSTYGAGTGKSSSYQQMRVGLNSNFTVTFGKRMVIQSDQNGNVSILVKREES